ncbi:MAG: class I SAM-dependent methyltransferase [Salinibacterium sp.]|nr:methyltransferase domain-containing protein [Salinibacterium sp.]MBF0673164.1 class I SAM-dependent methyltransferase [Salinibacterium sp.]
MNERKPERYTHGHHESVLRSHTWRTVENSAAYLESHLRPGVSVLDIGCGPGTITVDIARRVAPGRVVGLDAAPEVIEKARALALEEGLDNVEFVVGDAYDTRYDEASFDVVHAHQTLQHLADPVAALREMRRVVGDDGVVAARDVDYAGTMVHPSSAGLEAWAALYQRVHRSNGGEPNAGRQLKEWALAAGFTQVASTASIWCFASAEEREWWGGMWRDRALESAFASDAMSKGLVTRSELEDVSRAWQSWAAEPAGWMGMPHGEVLCRG